MSELDNQAEQFDEGYFMCHFGTWLMAYSQRLDLPPGFFERRRHLAAVHHSEAERQGHGLMRINKLMSALVNTPGRMQAIDEGSRAFIKSVPGNPSWDISIHTHIESTRVLVLPGSPNERLFLLGLEMNDIGDAMGLPPGTLNYDIYIQSQKEALLALPDDVSRTLGAERAMMLDEQAQAMLHRLNQKVIERFVIGHAYLDDDGYEVMTSGVQVTVSPSDVVVDGLVYYGNRWLNYRRSNPVAGGGHDLSASLQVYDRGAENSEGYQIWDNTVGLFDLAFQQVPSISDRSSRR